MCHQLTALNYLSTIKNSTFAITQKDNLQLFFLLLNGYTQNITGSLSHCRDFIIQPNCFSLAVINNFDPLNLKVLRSKSATQMLD